MTSTTLPQASDAVKLLGQMVAARRRELGFTAEDLAARIGVTRATLRKVERGDPGVAIGTTFTAAVIVGIPLFQTTDRSELVAHGNELARRLALLPANVHRPRVDDDF